MTRRSQEPPLVIIKDTREPDEAANDHHDAIFRPRVFAAGIPKGTPYADRPRIEVPTVRQKLDVGDYSLPGLETMVALERKSLPDLLATLFGEAGNDALGEARHNLDRFRAELERAYSQRYQLFGIVVEGSVDALYVEASKRWRRYGKSFDPEAVFAILRSFSVDLACATTWCAPVWEFPVDPDGEVRRRGRLLVSARQSAELEVGSTLARVWSQATGGSKARDARKRGYSMAWLGALDGVVGDAPAAPAEPTAEAPVDMDKVAAAFAEMRAEGAKVRAARDFAGGMATDPAEYQRRRAARKRPAAG